MSPEANDAQGAVEQATPASPMPSVPGGPAPASPQPPAVDVEAVARRAAEIVRGELDPVLDDRVDARFKSTTHGRFKDVQRIADYLAQSSGNVEQAARNLVLDEIVAERQGPQGGAEGTASAIDRPWETARAKSAAILSGAGLAVDDPGYVALVEQYRGRIDPSDWPDIAQHYADNATRKQSRQTSVTASAAVGGGGSAAPAGDVDTLTEELEAIQSGKRGSLTDPKLQAKRKELRRQLAELTPQRPDIR